MLKDQNDYPLPLHRRVLRSAMFRSGLSARLGPLYWCPTESAPYIHVLYEHEVEMFADIPTIFSDPPYDAMIGPASARWSNFAERVTAIDDCWVEPNRLQIIGRDGRLITQSLTHRLLPLYPSAWGAALRGGGSKLDEAIVYDGFNSQSYFHHLVDTAPSIILYFERSGLPSDLPLLVSRWLYESRFFKYLRSRSPFFAQLNWRVQEAGEWIHVNRAYRIHAAPYDRSAYNQIRDWHGRLSEPKGRRIFLSRDSSKFGRGISNEREVASLLERHGFETIYAENLSLEEQQQTFEETSYLVALQGMGLVQQIFMEPEQAHILELIPSSRLCSEYYWQGWTLGVRYYDVQSGSALDSRVMYEIDCVRLESAVRRMLDHPRGTRQYGETSIADA